jgi:hypothetical protein
MFVPDGSFSNPCLQIPSLLKIDATDVEEKNVLDVHMLNSKPFATPYIGHPQGQSAGAGS